MDEATVPDHAELPKIDESLLAIDPQDLTTAQSVQVNIGERVEKIRLLESDTNLFSKEMDVLSPSLRQEFIDIYKEEIKELQTLDTDNPSDKDLSKISKKYGQQRDDLFERYYRFPQT